MCRNRMIYCATVTVEILVIYQGRESLRIELVCCFGGDFSWTWWRIILLICKQTSCHITTVMDYSKSQAMIKYSLRKQNPRITFYWRFNKSLILTWTCTRCLHHVTIPDNNVINVTNVFSYFSKFRRIRQLGRERSKRTGLTLSYPCRRLFFILY